MCVLYSGNSIAEITTALKNQWWHKEHGEASVKKRWREDHAHRPHAVPGDGVEVSEKARREVRDLGLLQDATSLLRQTRTCQPHGAHAPVAKDAERDDGREGEGEGKGFTTFHQRK